MKLSKNWTTVTPLSKAIALALFVALPFIGFYFGRAIKKPAVEPQKSADQIALLPQPSLRPLEIPSDIKNWKQYDGNGFSFHYPRSLSITRNEDESTFWKSDYTSGNYIYNALILTSQENPFPELSINSGVMMYPSQKDKFVPSLVSILSVESADVRVDNRTMKLTTIGCGVDCTYHIFRFTRGHKFYQLMSDGAGGGLLLKMKQLLSTFKFQE